MILTADDFGLSPSISRGILKLAEAKRITAASCVVTEHGSQEALRELRSVSAGIDVGLHLVLTDSQPSAKTPAYSTLLDTGRFPSFREIAARAFLGRLKEVDLRREISTQLECFVSSFGQLPRYIDGHQHVHQLPQIREVLVKVLSEYSKIEYIRIFSFPSNRLSTLAASFSYQAAAENFGLSMAGRKLRHLLDQAGIAHNVHLLGHYSYESPVPFSSVLRAYTEANPEINDIFVCHPGELTRSTRDPLSLTRPLTLEYLLSEDFSEALINRKITLNVFDSSQLRSSGQA